MPLTVIVSFDPADNIARFELDTSSMSTTQKLSHVLMSTFEHSTDEDWDNLSALEEGTIVALEIPTNLSSWRHQSRKIQRALELAHFWDIPQEDCAVLWKTQDGTSYNEIDEIPGPEDTVHNAGTATINDFLRVGDPCYKWSEFEDTHLEVLPGTWTFELTCRDDNTHGMGNGYRPARLVAYNLDAGPVDVEALIATGSLHTRCGVDSAVCGFFFDEPPTSDEKQKQEWRQDLADHLHSEEDFRPPVHSMPNAVIAATFLGDGNYPMFAQRNEKGQAIAVALVTDNYDPVLAKNPQWAMEYGESDGMEF